MREVLDALLLLHDSIDLSKAPNFEVWRRKWGILTSTMEIQEGSRSLMPCEHAELTKVLMALNVWIATHS